MVIRSPSDRRASDALIAAEIRIAIQGVRNAYGGALEMAEDIHFGHGKGHGRSREHGALRSAR